MPSKSPQAQLDRVANPAGRLVSVNVGLPKDVPWHGKTVFTGVFKDPVSGPRRVGKLNVEGDGQGDLAGHGGEQRAVFVYQLDSYRHWEQELERDDFVHGQFGENFTIEGLGDDQVCIGDRYRIGSATFEVTQPRVTCCVGWQTSFRALLDGDAARGNVGLSTASPPPVWTGFRRLEVTAVERESDSVISIRFEDPDGEALPAARPGQYLTLRIQPIDAARPLLRNYSLSGPPAAGYYRIAVKREKDGAASGYLHSRLAVGDQLDVAAPRGTFILDESEEPVLLISAGIGATPVLAMLNTLSEQRSARQIWWLHGARSGREDSFAAETRALLAGCPDTRIRIYYSQPRAEDVEGRDFDRTGHLTPSLLLELEPPRSAQAYICGPMKFMNEVSAALASIGLDASRIHTEPFGPEPGSTPGIAAGPTRTPHLPSGSSGDGPTIQFARSNLSVPWSKGYGSLLELAEACDVPVRWSCRTGVCHNCETTLIAGDLDYDPDPVEPPAEGSALICCSRPHDDVVLDL